MSRQSSSLMLLCIIVVSAFGVGFAAHGLMAELMRPNLKESVIIRLEREAGDQEPDGTLTLTVDYSRNLKDFIAAGKFDVVEKSITEENFLLTKDEPKGSIEHQFKLYYFGYSEQQENLTYDYVVAQMDKHGKRPATLRELIAFSKANPGYRGEFVIWALGSVWTDPNGNRCVPYLGKFNKDNTRGLYLLNLDELPPVNLDEGLVAFIDMPAWRFDRSHRFLAVSKHPRAPEPRDD